MFEHSADEAWGVIRDFNNYPVWVDGASESEIEEGKSGGSVGAIRSVLYKDIRRRQRLLALSDVERSQTYAFAGEAPIPTQSFEATIRVTPIINGNRAFIEWWTTFNCEPDVREERVAFFRDAFARWLGSLRRHLER